MAEHHSGSVSAPPLHHHIPHHHHHIRRHRVPSGGEEQDWQEDEELDPRIQIELEKLNRASEEINRLELELDDARAAFRQVLSDSTQRLNGLAKKLGTCVDKARPYYDSRMRLKEAHLESQKAALRFERACSMHEAAKEMVQLAEEGYKRREQDLDPTWQEMLNHATMKVNDAERERMESEDFHQKTTLNFKQREEEVQKHQKDLKRSIAKSKPYFEMKAKFNQVMEDCKRNVSRLEEDVGSAKALYSQALRSLEAISDDIHRQRLERRQKLQLGVRGAGVGAEAPSPPPSWEKGMNIEGSASSHTYDSDADNDPLNASRGSHSSETVLDVSQLSLKRSSKGIVRHEPAYRKKTSLTESFLVDGHYKTDPLDVVVFKTSTSDLHGSSSPPTHSHGFQPPSVIRPEAERARNPSYRTAVDKSQEEVEDIQGWPRRDVVEGMDEDYGDNVVTPTPENVVTERSSSSSKSGQGIDSAQRGREIIISPGRDSNGSPLSESPRRRDIELNQSSLSRAQEWVNKSPIPQQRRFVKSKSLVDASSSSLSVSSPPESELSSSLTTDVMRGMARRGVSEKHPSHPQTVVVSSVAATPLPAGVPSVDTMAEILQENQPRIVTAEPSHSTLSTTPHLTSSQNSVRSLASTPEQPSPLSGSPSAHRKSPKLQGLILRVDATGIAPTSTQPTTQQSESQTYSSAGINPKLVISTQHPKLGVFIEKPAPPQPQSSLLSTSTTTSASSLPPSAKPPTSLIAQHLNKMKNVTKVSSYNSKTAPSTLSTSYHLPSSSSSPQKSPHGFPSKPQSSPTRNPLSPIPPCASASLRHQLTSPTPSSPSADRYSLSGRSDSAASGSHKSAFLKPPSDSSDTESIASTGPMLDDDQVELINMDFTEQSIAPDSQDDQDYRDGPIDPASVSRGHWSRMSLPPRLSYLEGFLERARLYAGDTKNETEDESEDRYSNDNGGNRSDDEDARSSVAASGDLDDKKDDFNDDICNDEAGVCGSAQDGDICDKAGDSMPSHMNSTDNGNPDVDISVQINLWNETGAERGTMGESANNSERSSAGHRTFDIHKTSDSLSANEATTLGSSTETTVVISLDEGIKHIEGTTAPAAELSSAKEEGKSKEGESVEHFV